VCNIYLFPLASERSVKRYLRRAERKIQLVCRNIASGIVKKRGFNIGSRILGLPQGLLWPLFERKAQKSVRINSDCTQCGLCDSVCPVNKQSCIVCYRCVNQCPEKAITVLFHGKVREQYKGLELSK
jgi:NAD-dependent dihydropyrimidine dehydrogenase PreA subunit